MHYAPRGFGGPPFSNFMLGVAAAATPYLVNGMLAVWERHRSHAQRAHWHHAQRRLPH